MCNQYPHFEFTHDELVLIETAKGEEGSTWSSKTIEDVKVRIKQHYRENIIDECCYCRRSFTGEFNMVIDIEHILPKSVFEELMFNLENLSLACKRCNMQIKKADISFITDIESVRVTPFDSQFYLLVHPNVDIYFDHLGLSTFNQDGKKFVKYYPKNSSSKGAYTYNYFRLEELELDDMAIAQGGAPDVRISERIPEEIQDRLLDFIDRLN